MMEMWLTIQFAADSRGRRGADAQTQPFPAAAGGVLPQQTERFVTGTRDSRARLREERREISSLYSSAIGIFDYFA